MYKSLKRFSVFFTSFFIFCIHLPFVFAKTISANKESSVKPASVASTSTYPVAAGLPGSEKVSVFDSLHLNTLGLTRQAYDYAIRGFQTLLSMGKLNNDSVISIADFSLSSAQKRLYVIDIKNYRLLFNTYVAHGRNSGAEFAKRFSNSLSSNESSLGFYVTGDTYSGEHGYSLRLEGEEKGINDNAFKRAIVMHCADYASEGFIKLKGYLGRSLGCPAIPEKVYKPIIDQIKEGSCLFLYSPNRYYLSHSTFLKNADDVVDAS